MEKRPFLALLLVLASAFSLFAGCATQTPLRTRAVQKKRIPQKSASPRRLQRTPEYRLGFGDVVEVKFFYNDQLNEVVAVRPDGRISLQRIGDLYVSGMTPSQLDTIVTRTYNDIVLDPEVTVIIREFGGYQVYVLGEVQAPGGYAIQRNMTILQAVASAGGPKRSAKFGSVMILRRSNNGEVEAIKVNLAKSVKAKSAIDIGQNNIMVQPQDIIFIPKTFIASASDFMDQVYTGFLPPVDLYLRSILFSN